MNILQINSSARANGSSSTRLATALVEQLVARNPDALIKVRSLARQPHPHLDEAALQALFTPAEARDAAQAARVAQDDLLIAELQWADTIVLGVPMYNFGVPAQLKNWIDAISRAGVTFRYSATGPEGLVTGKTVYVAHTRGGKTRDTPLDSTTPYLKTALGFLGMSDVRQVYAEGLAMGEQSQQEGFERAHREIEAAVGVTADHA